MIIIQLVLLCPCRTPNIIKSIKPPENVNPTVIFKICATIYALPANKTWTPNKIGATNIKENSIGSVIPVNILVKAADNNKPPHAFLFLESAHWYIAKAAPGNPKIIKINSPVKYLVASTL